MLDRNGKEVALPTAPCEQAVPEGLANTLTNALAKDTTMGTGAAAAGSVGWGLPMAGKTGTTESHRSAGFLGYTNQLAAASYVFDDSPKPAALCAFPLRKCGERKPVRRYVAGADLVPGDESDRHRLRPGRATTDRPALRRRRPGDSHPQRRRP